MEIKRDEHGKKGAFYIEKDGDWIAEMTYQREGERKIVIDHTEVEEEYREQGLGNQLLDAAVKFARDNNLLIKPTCPFVKSILEADEEYEDVLTR